MALEITHIGNAQSTVDQTTYDFGDFTAAEAGLMVVVAAGYAVGAPTISSVSIGGTNGTIVINASAHDRVVQAIAAREIAAGAQNVSVTFGGTVLVAQVSVYLLTGHDSATPSDTDFQYNGSATALTATLDFPADGIAVYGFQGQNTSGVGITWSAATDVYDVEADTKFSSAHKTATGAGNTETATSTGAGNGRVSIIGAVWTPAAAGGGTILPQMMQHYHGGVA